MLIVYKAEEKPKKIRVKNHYITKYESEPANRECVNRTADELGYSRELVKELALFMNKDFLVTNMLQGNVVKLPEIGIFEFVKDAKEKREKRKEKKRLRELALIEEMQAQNILGFDNFDPNDL